MLENELKTLHQMWVDEPLKILNANKKKIQFLGQLQRSVKKKVNEAILDEGLDLPVNQHDHQQLVVL